MASSRESSLNREAGLATAWEWSPNFRLEYPLEPSPWAVTRRTSDRDGHHLAVTRTAESVAKTS